MQLLAVAVGGVLGSLGRYAVAIAMVDGGEWRPDHLPWATLLVNVLGCLLIGILATRLDADGPAWLRPFLITGVLGGFTTFSAFALEAALLLDAGRVLLAAGYVAATMAAGLGAVRIGAGLAGRSPRRRPA